MLQDEPTLAIGGVDNSLCPGICAKQQTGVACVEKYQLNKQQTQHGTTQVRVTENDWVNDPESLGKATEVHYRDDHLRVTGSWSVFEYDDDDDDDDDDE